MHLVSNPEGKKTYPVQKPKRKKFQSGKGEALDREDVELLVLTESQDKEGDLFSVPSYSCC